MVFPKMGASGKCIMTIESEGSGIGQKNYKKKRVGGGSLRNACVIILPTLKRKKLTRA